MPSFKKLLCAGVLGAGVDPDAASWAAAVTGAGGTYSTSTLLAISAFCVSAKASNYWTKLNRINLFCGDQLAAALVPLKAGGGTATETNVNFVSGDYTEATGITGNGSTKYLNTGLLSSALTANDTHLAVYNRSSTAAAGGIGIGGVDGTSSGIEMQAPSTAGTLVSDQYDNASGRVTSGVIGTPFGFLVGSRTGAGAHAAYRNGSSIASNATSGGTLTANAIFVFARNVLGTAGSFISQPLASYSIGAGLTAADVTAYNTHMQAFQLALGRNV